MITMPLDKLGVSGINICANAARGEIIAWPPEFTTSGLSVSFSLRKGWVWLPAVSSLHRSR